MSYSDLTKEQLQEQIEMLEEKYKKMRSLALKVAKEMDSLSEQYRCLTEEMNKRESKLRDDTE